MTADSPAPADAGAILDALPLTVFRVGPDLRLTYANRHGCQLVGLSPGEVVGRSCLELGMDPGSYGRWVEHLRQTFASGRSGHFEYLRAPSPDEELFEYRFLPECGPTGEVASVLVAAVANHEVKTLRAALRCRDELFHTFMDCVPASAWLRDEPGRYVFTNRTYQEQFRVRPEDRVGRTFEQVWPPDVAARLRANDRKVLDTGRSEQFLEAAPAPDGSVRTLLNVKFPFTGPDGTRYVGGVGVDVTEREREAAARRELDARVVSAQKIESLGLLAAGAAHDFKNVLSVILGNAELAAAEFPPGSPAGAYIQAILAAGDRAAELCGQMLAFAGNGRPRPGPSDLGAVARDTVRLLQPKGRRRVEVRVEAPPAVPRVWADPSQLGQVVLNLFTNALQAVGEGPGEVRVAVAAAADKVLLEVADDGCGIPEADVGQVFDPFFTTKADGRGLGLAAVAGIVRELGGTIGVESAVGRGTTFRVSLPAHHPVTA